MRKMSVKLRVTLWYMLAVSIISVIVMLVMNSHAESMIMHDIQLRMERAVGKMSERLVDKHGNLRPPPDFMFYDDGVHMILYNGEKSVIGGVKPFFISYDILVGDNSFRKTESNGERYYEYDKELEILGKMYYLKGFTSAKNELTGISQMLKSNLLLVIIMIVIAGLGGYFIISRAFLPVKKISRTAEQISSGDDLSRRINIGSEIGNDEIYNLANVFDKMLDKIERLFKKEKQFTSDASHELRTPVAVILSECEYLEDGEKSIDEYKEGIESIKRQSKKMSKLISELLMISRMDANTLKTEFETVDLSELLEFICDEQEQIRNGNVALAKNISSGIMVEGDRFLLTRLIINLINNAYQYIGNGDRIEAGLSEENGKVCLWIEDNGIGIKEEEISKIWDRFYQADSARTNDGSGSMGLGLSMVKWIAKCHGGEISVVSQEGTGSRFTFILNKKEKS